MSYFADLPTIQYDGPESRNPLAFRWYDANRNVMGKTMREHLRWAICYWHSFAWAGSDVFGAGTFERPWAPGQPVTPERAQIKLNVTLRGKLAINAAPLPLKCKSLGVGLPA
jgi:xylose isomerase